jgi:aminoglycoside phosphotransferase (APT) family kinase protein
VMIDGQQIGFIDFDDFCMAEPALDVGLFCSAICDIGMNAGDNAFFADRTARLARLDQLDTLCEVFIAEYAQHASLSRQRVVLWQALDFLRNCLHYWIKVKPSEPDSSMLVLDRLLTDLGR